MPSSPFDADSRLCVRPAGVSPAFPLATPLPSTASAGSPLFGGFPGTMGVSDFSTTWMTGVRSMLRLCSTCVSCAPTTAGTVTGTPPPRDAVQHFHLHPSSTGQRRLDLVESRRIVDGCKIASVAAFCQRLDRAPQHLPRAGLGQTGDEVHALRSGNGTQTAIDSLLDLCFQRGPQLRCGNPRRVLDHGESDGFLSLQLIVHTHDSHFPHPRATLYGL